MGAVKGQLNVVRDEPGGLGLSVKEVEAAVGLHGEEGIREEPRGDQPKIDSQHVWPWVADSGPAVYLAASDLLGKYL